MRLALTRSFTTQARALCFHELEAIVQEEHLELLTRSDRALITAPRMVLNLNHWLWLMLV